MMSFAPTICSATSSESLIRFTASVILQLTYGHRVTSTVDDKFVQLFDIAVQRTVDAGTPGLMPVDLFPACQPALPPLLTSFSEYLLV